MRSSMENSSTRPVTTRSETTNPYPVTYVQTNTSCFKQVVQMLTGSSNPAHQPEPRFSYHSIPPIKAVPNKKQSSSFRLHERRNLLKQLKISSTHSGSRKTDNLSPSILDFPSLHLSPVTPLVPEPFSPSGVSNHSPTDPDPQASSDAEEIAIKEKGFYLHPSPRDAEPRLLSLFPSTSPRVSDSTS